MSRVRVAPSPIHGKGVFVTRTTTQGSLLDSGVVLEVEKITTRCPEVWDHVLSDEDGAWLPLGAAIFTNHARPPNAELYREGEQYELRAQRQLPMGTEVTIDYGAEW